MAAVPAGVSFDKTVHDFGKVSEADGKLECIFTATNTGDSPLLIQSVITSCGCTGVKWTRTEIAPGTSGTITVIYDNDEGPYPFDKTVTVYTSASRKPTVLHIKGIVKKK